MRKYALLAMLFIGISAFGAGLYSAHVNAQANKNQASNQPKSKPLARQEPYGTKRVSVKPGDTLSRIALANKSTYLRLFYANKQVKDPDEIYPGQKLRIPHPKEKLAKRPLPSVQVVTYSAPANYQPSRAVSTVANNIDGGVWDRLAACESGGNWSINTGNGYYGGLQFNLGTWQANGGTGYPHQASKAEQIRVAENLRASRGFSPWPACSAQLGLR